MQVRRMLAIGPPAYNAAPNAEVAERLRHVAPLLVVRRIAGTGALVAAALALAGLLPLTRPLVLLLLLGGTAFEVERGVVLRAPSVAAIEDRMTLFAYMYVFLALLLLHLTAEVLWVGLLALALTLSGSGTVLGRRSLVTVTAFASLGFIAYFVAGSAGVLTQPVETFDEGRLAVYAQGGWYTLAAIVGAGLLGFPSLSLVSYATTQRLRRTRDDLRTAASHLREAERELSDSHDRLAGWNERLSAEVKQKTAELEAQNRHLGMINAVASALSASSSGSGAQQRVCEIVASALGVRIAQLVIPGEGPLALRAGADLAPAGAATPWLPDAAFRRIVADGAPLFSRDRAFESIAGVARSIGAAGDGVIAIVPVSAAGHALGGLALYGQRMDEWTDLERDALRLIGREIGIAYEHARRHDDALSAAEKEAALADALRLIVAERDTDRSLSRALAAIAGPLRLRFAAVAAAGNRPPQLFEWGERSVSERRAIADFVDAATSRMHDRSGPLVLGAGGETPLSEGMRAARVETLVVVPLMGAGGDGATPPGASTDDWAERSSVVGSVVAGSERGALLQAGDIELIDRLAAAIARRLESDALLRLRERRIRELSALSDVASAMQAAGGEERLYAGFASALAALVPYRRLLFASDDGEDELTEVFRFGPAGSDPAIVALKPAERRYFRVARRSMSVWERAHAQDGAPPFVSADDRFAVTVPLRPKGQLLGVMVVVTDERPTGDIAALISQAAEMLALALDGAVLYRQATERAARIQVMSHLAHIVASVVDLRDAFGAFADEVRWLIPFDEAVMMLVDTEAAVVLPYASYPHQIPVDAPPEALRGSIAEAAIDAAGPTAISRSDARFTSANWGALGDEVQEVATVPVMQDGRCRAIFALARSSGAPYPPGAFTSLEEISDLLAVTIDRLRLYERAEYNARHDLLTGLPNRRFLNERLAELHETLAGGLVAVVMIDMDGLKIVNDTLGHEAGDAAIRLLAREIQAAARAEDFVARVGGDEFVVLMEDCDADPALRMTERLHGVLRAVGPDSLPADTRISVSAGIAVAPDDGRDSERLLQEADRAMYEAKFSGGHRTLLARDRTTGGGGRRAGDRRGGRVMETLIRAVVAGASDAERRALLLASSSALQAAARLALPGDMLPSLRLLVAAESAVRLLEPQASADRDAALLLAAGLRGAVSGRTPEEASILATVARLTVQLAWMRAAAPVGSGFSLDEALQRLDREADGELADGILQAVASGVRVADAQAAETSRVA